MSKHDYCIQISNIDNCFCGMFYNKQAIAELAEPFENCPDDIMAIYLDRINKSIDIDKPDKETIEQLKNHSCDTHTKLNYKKFNYIYKNGDKEKTIQSDKPIELKQLKDLING